VSRPQTSAKPEFSCGGPYANFKGWKATCQAAVAEVHSKKPFPWKNALTAIGAITAIFCTLVTDGAGASVCEDLAGGEGEVAVPQTAEDTLDYVETHNGAAPPGYKGGTVFQNNDNILPNYDSSGASITYKEYDINPYQKGVDRGGERVVVGSNGNVYYTNSHYATFTLMRNGG
jgi:guanyl-specific ribonuclease Sa